jgi:hypothetical protein
MGTVSVYGYCIGTLLMFNDMPSHPIEPDRPTNMREARTSQKFSRIKLDTPGPWQYRSLNPQSKSSAPQHSVTADADADARRPVQLGDRNPDDGSSNTDMTLADSRLQLKIYGGSVNGGGTGTSRKRSISSHH